MQTVEILETVRQKIADGDTQGAESFLVEHFKELPEDIQGDLLIGFINDAAAPNRLENMASDMMEAAMMMLDKTKQAEAELEKTPGEGN